MKKYIRELSLLEAVKNEMEWYEDFFSKEYCIFQLQNQKDYEALCGRQISDLAKWLNLHREIRVLNCGCGMGEHDGFLKQYCSVDGLDVSTEMLNFAIKRNPELNYILADFTKKVLVSRSFDIALFLNTTFGYMDDSLQAQTLINISEILSKNGQIILDLINPYIFFNNFKTHLIDKKNDYKLEQYSSYNPITQWVINDWELSAPLKNHVKKKFKVKLFMPRDIFQLASDANLEIEGFFGDYKGSKFEMDSPRMVVKLVKDIRLIPKSIKG